MAHVKIAVDAMGGDNAPAEIVKGCLNYINNEEIDSVKIILVGKEDLVQSALLQHKYDQVKIEICKASEYIGPSELPVVAVRNKKDSSIVKGIKLVNDGEADVFISAGNTGAVLVGSTFGLGRVKGVERPALAVLLPNKEGFSLLIDAGANVDVKPNYLLQFAKMGKVYLENMLGVDNPTVGLVNIGEEPEKGNALTKEAYKILKDSDVNFIGNVEAREIPEGKADILVCDAFVGNIILKYTEGLSKTLFSIIKDEINANPVTKIGGALIKKAFPNIRKRLDYEEYGGAPFLGLKGFVIKIHGSSSAKSVESAIRQAVNFTKQNLVQKIEEEFK